MRKIIFLLSVCCILTCHPSKIEKPSKAQREHFSKAYVQILIIQQTYINQTTIIQDSTQKILEKHHLTKQDIDNIVAWYDEKPKRWKRFFQKTLTLLETEYRFSPIKQDSLPKARLLINKSVEAVRR